MVELLNEIFDLNVRLLLKREEGKCRVTLVHRSSNESSSVLVALDNDEELLGAMKLAKDKLIKQL